jgi:hypothetical protein
VRNCAALKVRNCAALKVRNCAALKVRNRLMRADRLTGGPVAPIVGRYLCFAFHASRPNRRSARALRRDPPA